MLRGNEKKNIFLDSEDKAKFIDTIYYKKKESEFCLYAYCVMDNHVHLVIKEQDDSISRIMRKIVTSYAIYFNKKYKRVGHVFQDRYRSETIDNERHLLAVIRYVHNNPVKAGIGNRQEYKWSSYQYYIQKQGNKDQPKILDQDEILRIFSDEKDKAIILFKEFSNHEDEGDFMDMNEEEDMFDEVEALEYINNYLSNKNILLEHLKQKEYKKERDFLVKKLIEKSQLSLRKIAEILGLNRETVRKISMSSEPSP